MTGTTERQYRVTIRKRHPAWDETNGIVYTVNATGKSRAIRDARRMAEDGGHVGSGQGHYTMTAEDVGPAEYGE
jgi:hypothetical protein